MPNPVLRDGVYYANMAEPPGRWRQAWSSFGRAVFHAIAWAGRTSKRAIASLPWIAGGPRSSASVSAEAALSLIPLWGCVRILADNVASLPVQTYKRIGDKREPSSFIPQLFWEPSARDNPFQWLHKCVVSIALRGNAYGLVVNRDDFGMPTQIEWLHPDEVFVDERRPTMPAFYWLGQEVPRENIVHIPWMVMPGRVVGLSPVQAFASSIGVGIAATDYGLRWFDQGGAPPATMKNNAKTVDAATAEAISDRLAARMRIGKPLVFGSDWDFDAISINPEEAQFIQTMQLNATQIAAIFGIPAEMVGGQTGGSLTYNSPEQNVIYLAQITLRPWLVRLESVFSRLLAGREYVRFNVDSMIRTELLPRYQAHQLALSSGWRSVDEIRALEDLPPLPNGQGQGFAAPEKSSARELGLVEMVQKIYLGVGTVLTWEEAREILNRSGAQLDLNVPQPSKAVLSPPSPVDAGGQRNGRIL